MKLSNHSKERLLESFRHYGVSGENLHPLYNYLVYGLEPGSFWRAIFENDFIQAMLCSHVANRIEHLKCAAKWIEFEMPTEAWGSHDIVNCWLAKTDEERRTILENKQLIYTPEYETWLALKEENHERFN
jgi:hypothetical protein